MVNTVIAVVACGMVIAVIIVVAYSMVKVVSKENVVIAV